MESKEEGNGGHVSPKHGSDEREENYRPPDYATLKKSVDNLRKQLDVTMNRYTAPTYEKLKIGAKNFLADYIKQKPMSSSSWLARATTKEDKRKKEITFINLVINALGSQTDPKDNEGNHKVALGAFFYRRMRIIMAYEALHTTGKSCLTLQLINEKLEVNEKNIIDDITQHACLIAFKKFLETNDLEGNKMYTRFEESKNWKIFSKKLDGVIKKTSNSESKKHMDDYLGYLNFIESMVKQIDSHYQKVNAQLCSLYDMFPKTTGKLAKECESFFPWVEGLLKKMNLTKTEKQSISDAIEYLQNSSYAEKFINVTDQGGLQVCKQLIKDCIDTHFTYFLLGTLVICDRCCLTKFSKLNIFPELNIVLRRAMDHRPKNEMQARDIAKSCELLKSFIENVADEKQLHTGAWYNLDRLKSVLDDNIYQDREPTSRVVCSI